MEDLTRKFETEKDARDFMRDNPAVEFSLVFSDGLYYVEWGKPGVFVRTWESLLFEGLGREA